MIVLKCLGNGLKLVFRLCCMNKFCVFIVDDDVELVEMVSELLVCEGWEV